MKRGAAFTAASRIYEYNSQIIYHAILRARGYKCLDIMREIISSFFVSRLIEFY